MRFYVIYELDAPSGAGGVNRFAPPGWNMGKQKRGTTPWQKTESGSSEYSYLGGVWGFGSVHGKWVGELTRGQFDEFVLECYLRSDTTETMGSLTLDYGWLPAINFEVMLYDEVIGSCYVTPLPCKPDGRPIREEGMDERDWERVRAAVIKHYRDW